MTPDTRGARPENRETATAGTQGMGGGEGRPVAETLFAVESEAATRLRKGEYVLAATRWPNNAAMVLDLAKLGYLRREWHTLDPTYNRGAWWLRWRPAGLVTNDLDPTTDADFHQDFRQMSWPDGSFDAIAYDPPYVCAGGRTTTGIAEFHDRFGMDDAPRRAEDLQVLINDGLTEMARLARAGGVILVKCKDYISSGRLFEGTYLTRKHAEGLGLKCEDRLEYIGNQSPQSQARQLHARRNLSTLFVFKKAAAHA